MFSNFNLHFDCHHPWFECDQISFSFGFMTTYVLCEIELKVLLYLNISTLSFSMQ